MHEFSLCEGILKQVAKANQNNLNNVTKINIIIGKLAGVDLQSLLFWFPVVLKKRCLHEIVIEVEEPIGKAICKSCNHTFEIINLYDPCPTCNTFGDYEITSGRELLVKSFELQSN